METSILKKNNTLFEQLSADIPAEVKKYVQKQGDIAVQIATILKNKGIKQKEFAKQIGMKESQLSKILAGNANCTLKTIVKIEAALGEDIITVPKFAQRYEKTPKIYFTLNDKFHAKVLTKSKEPASPIIN